MKHKKNLRKYGLEGMCRLFLGLLHESRSCVLQSGLEMHHRKLMEKVCQSTIQNFHPIGDF